MMFSSRSFLTRFHEFSRKRRLLQEHSRVVVAVSGGVDSMVLLDLLAKEQEAFGLSIVVAHFNFQLRGHESDADEQLVAQRTRHFGYELYVERANTNEYARHHKLGIQEAARNLRYEFFDKLLVSSGFDRIATAHNADDNAETLLLNLFRGAGVQGLAGIPIWREDKHIIRPLLFAERSDIEAYAREENVPYSNDSSNDQEYYTRNYIRHKVLPLIKGQVNPNVVQTLYRSSELFSELEAFLSSTAHENFASVVSQKGDDELHINIPRLRGFPILIQQYTVMRAAEHLAKRKLEYEQVNAILDLTEGLTGSWVPISKTHVVFRDREHLVMRRSEEAREFKFTVVPNHRYEFDRFLFASEYIEPASIAQYATGWEYVDADKLNGGELVLRSWSEGDAFVPLGMKSKKKISDFFVDAKIPIYEKHQIPILETRGGDVVWVCGQRIDDRFKVTIETKRALRLQFSRQTAKANGEAVKS